MYLIRIRATARTAPRKRTGMNGIIIIIGKGIVAEITPVIKEIDLMVPTDKDLTLEDITLMKIIIHTEMIENIKPRVKSHQGFRGS